MSMPWALALKCWREVCKPFASIQFTTHHTMFFRQTKITPIEIGIVKTDREFKLSWLLYLQEIKAIGQYEMVELANYLQISHAETARIVNELERRGLVEMTWPADRKTIVKCTAAGLHYVRTTANALASSI